MPLEELPQVLASIIVPALCVGTAAKFSIDSGHRLRAAGMPWWEAVVAVLGLYVAMVLLLTFVAALGWTVAMPLHDALGLHRGVADFGVLFLGILVSVVAAVASVCAVLTLSAFTVFDHWRRRSEAPAPHGSARRQMLASVATVALGAMATELAYGALDLLRPTRTGK